MFLVPIPRESWDADHARELVLKRRVIAIEEICASLLSAAIAQSTPKVMMITTSHVWLPSLYDFKNRTAEDIVFFLDSSATTFIIGCSKDSK